jgi:hypothetical protein
VDVLELLDAVEGDRELLHLDRLLVPVARLRRHAGVLADVDHELRVLGVRRGLRRDLDDVHRVIVDRRVREPLVVAVLDLRRDDVLEREVRAEDRLLAEVHAADLARRVQVHELVVRPLDVVDDEVAREAQVERVLVPHERLREHAGARLVLVVAEALPRHAEARLLRLVALVAGDELRLLLVRSEAVVQHARVDVAAGEPVGRLGDRVVGRADQKDGEHCGGQRGEQAGAGGGAHRGAPGEDRREVQAEASAAASFRRAAMAAE